MQRIQWALDKLQTEDVQVLLLVAVVGGLILAFILWLVGKFKLTSRFLYRFGRKKADETYKDVFQD